MLSVPGIRRFFAPCAEGKLKAATAGILQFTVVQSLRRLGLFWVDVALD